jgi:hypothetical protein
VKAAHDDATQQHPLCDRHLVAPQAFNQFDNAARVVALSVGRSIRASRLSPRKVLKKWHADKPALRPDPAAKHKA